MCKRRREKLSLPERQVDLWWEDIDSQIDRIPEFRGILSKEEKKRADRFRFELNRNRFMVQHGRLREILGGYLNMPPESLLFARGSDGKPYVSHQGDPKIRFNLSHSHGYALLAAAWGREVGVDVEAVQPRPNAAKLVERFFSSAEKAAFRKLPSDEKDAAFYAGWTRKEAWVKAIGKGLGFPLDRFDVSLKPGDQNALLHVEGDLEATRRWSLMDIDLGPDFHAALAVERLSGEREIFLRFKS